MSHRNSFHSTVGSLPTKTIAQPNVQLTNSVWAVQENLQIFCNTLTVAEDITHLCSVDLPYVLTIHCQNVISAGKKISLSGVPGQDRTAQALMGENGEDGGTGSNGGKINFWAKNMSGSLTLEADGGRGGNGQQGGNGLPGDQGAPGSDAVIHQHPQVDEVDPQGQPGGQGGTGNSGGRGGAGGNGGNGGETHVYHIVGSEKNQDFDIISSGASGHSGAPGAGGGGGQGGPGGMGGYLGQCSSYYDPQHTIYVNCRLSTTRAASGAVGSSGTPGAAGALGKEGEAGVSNVTSLSSTDYIWGGYWPIDVLKSLLSSSKENKDQDTLQWIVQITPSPNDKAFDKLPNREELSRIHDEAQAVLNATFR